MSIIHALAHLFGWNLGRVYTWRESDTGSLMVGFRCDKCGRIDDAHRSVSDRLLDAEIAAMAGACKRKPREKGEHEDGGP